jgi:hypothetical protein
MRQKGLHTLTKLFPFSCACVHLFIPVSYLSVPVFRPCRLLRRAHLKPHINIVHISLSMIISLSSVKIMKGTFSHSSEYSSVIIIWTYHLESSTVDSINLGMSCTIADIIGNIKIGNTLQFYVRLLRMQSHDER